MGLRFPIPSFIRLPGFLDAIDYDKLLSLRTNKYVEIRDRRIGFLYYLCNVCIIFYIVVYVFFVQQKYWEIEESDGVVTTKVKGSAWGPDDRRPQGFRSFDSGDLIYPGIEADGLFLGTKYQATNGQGFNLCSRSNPETDRCSRNEDCKLDPPLDVQQCVDGWCQSYQWCPAENETLPNDVTLLWNISGTENFTIWIKSFISFPALDRKRVFSSLINPNTTRNGTAKDLFTLQEILTMADPPIQYSDIEQTGAILRVVLRYDCYLYKEGPCLPVYKVYRMDGGVGYNMRKSSYFMGNNSDIGALRRNLVKMWGVRIFFAAKGSGYAFSPQQVILNIASAFALFSLSLLISEYAIFFFLPESSVYKNMVIETPDEFNDLPTQDSSGRKLNWEERLRCVDENYRKGLMRRRVQDNVVYDSLGSTTVSIQVEENSE